LRFMPPTAFRLAEALASRLNPTLPRPIHVLVERAASPATTHSDVIMAIAMLGGVQDSVIRIRRDRWPRLPTGDIALPDGRADSARVHLWFGPSENHAVLTLPPIELGELSS
jgi:hypothetical protein